MVHSEGKFRTISFECQDLIRKLLVHDTKQRLSSKQALKHGWFHKFAPPSKLKQEISEEAIIRIQTFRGVSTFKKAVMNLLVKMAPEEEMAPMRA